MYPFFYLSLSFILFVTMKQICIQNLSAPKDEFLEPPQSSKPITASGFITMVPKQPFSGCDSENPYHHL
jgi:hypothetical protein